MTDHDLIAHASDREIVAVTLFGEARGQSAALRLGIGNVIRNRAHLRRQPARTVCLAPKQFSCWLAIDPNYAVVLDALRHLSTGGHLGPVMRECLRLADGLLAETLRTNVGLSTHYYSPAAMVPRDRVPTWAQGRMPVTVIDGTRFYEGIA
ncbi:MAG: cell wall hydrolase [Candidatus Dormibacteria bacterium]